MNQGWEINRQNGTVTIFGMDPILDESDLILLLSDLQAGDTNLTDLAGT